MNKTNLTPMARRLNVDEHFSHGQFHREWLDQLFFDLHRSNKRLNDTWRLG